MAKAKHYVVWQGRKTGVFNYWGECKAAVEKFSGAKYKSFKSKNEAHQAFRSPPPTYPKRTASSFKKKQNTTEPLREKLPTSYLCVDAACSGNPGPTEYRGIWIEGEQHTQIFHQKFPRGTNNIGEFLALVHALAWLQKNEKNIPVYSDSKIALRWLYIGKCKTSLQPSSGSIFDFVHRGEDWLHKNDVEKYTLKKWDTKRRGEIPADFGRK